VSADRLGLPRPAGFPMQPPPSLVTLDSFGLCAQIAPKPPKLYDFPVVVDLDFVACEHVAGFWNALHFEDLNLDNPAILVAPNSRNPFCGDTRRARPGYPLPGERIEHLRWWLCAMSITRIIGLLRRKKSLNQLVFEAISFSIVD
jgi:hypothetical protein